MHTRTPLILLLGAALLLTPTHTPGAKAADLLQTLARPILDPEQPLREVQAFCDARIPHMPKVRTAGQWKRRADKMRRETLEKVVFRGEAGKWRDAKTKVEWLETIQLSGGDGAVHGSFDSCVGICERDHG